jgi:hypothetical protein
MLTYSAAREGGLQARHLGIQGQDSDGAREGARSHAAGRRRTTKKIKNKKSNFFCFRRQAMELEKARAATLLQVPS